MYEVELARSHAHYTGHRLGLFLVGIGQVVGGASLERDFRRAAQPAGVCQLRSKCACARAADLELPDHRALGLEHLNRGRGQDHAFIGERVVAAERNPQVRALDAVKRHPAVLGEAGRANRQRIDAAVDPSVRVIDQMQLRAHVFTATHVLTAIRAMDAV